MTGKVTYTHTSNQSADRLWQVVRDFTQADWLVGPGNYTVGEYDGHEARFIGTDTPITEFLLERDDEARFIRYGVLRNAFVPVDDYRARVTVATRGNRGIVTFESTFKIDEVPFDEVNTMLTGAYQMMGDRIEASLEESGSSE